MLFSSAPQKVVFKAFDRKHRLSTCSETTHFHDQVRYQLLPDDFQLDINFEGNPLSEIFNRLVNILSLVYLSSSASLNHEILPDKGYWNFNTNVVWLLRIPSYIKYITGFIRTETLPTKHWLHEIYFAFIADSQIFKKSTEKHLRQFNQTIICTLRIMYPGTFS